MAVSKEIHRTGWHEALGILLFALCVLGVLSLLSYDARDIGILQDPQSSPPSNFIGPVGAWFGFLSLMGLGVCGYLVPVLLAYVGALCLFKREGRIWTKSLLALAVLVCLSCLAELDGDAWEGARAKLNIVSAGGLAGYLVATSFLAGLLGQVGAFILTFAILLASLVLVLDVKPLSLLRVLWEKGRQLCEHVEAWRVSRLDRQKQIEEEERSVAKRRRRLEDVMKAPARAPATARVIEEAPVPVPVEAMAEVVPAAPPAPPEEIVAPPPPKPAREKTRARAAEAAAPKEEPPGEAAVLPPVEGSFVLPGLNLLDVVPPDKDREIKGDFSVGSQILKETLAEFGVEVDITNAERGPVVTRYELLPAPGVRVERIVGLSNNIALAMKAESVRVQAPVPGKGVVGIEVPNLKTTIVYLRDIVESDEWRSARSALPLALGKDVGGRVLAADLADMPHLLVAGATGSGKTVCMNSILAGLLLSRTPEQMRLMLIDPKIVEFSAYNHLPHLVVPVITDSKKVGLGLRWAINEMEKRYKLFARAGVRNIKAFNSRPVATQEELFGPAESPAEEVDKVPDRIPYIVIIVDELADLMLQAQAEIENHIARLAQLSRAVGIHMILATQRPSVNVITGTIKANFPARISFQVAQKVDSRTILDASGAEKLLGKGDLLFLPPGSSKLIRAQGTLTTDAEIHRIVDFIKAQGQPQYEMSIKEKIEGKAADIPDMEEDDGIIEAAMEIIRQTRRASTSSLQRRLRIGYTRAARIMDLLEQKGVVGPAQGADPREILIDLEGDVPQNEMKDEE
jgi:DNA segregation ATPase FtsK/SpoIIIE, S-DNA-T family